MSTAKQCLIVTSLIALLFLLFYLLYSGSIDVILYDKRGGWVGFFILFLVIPFMIYKLSQVLMAKSRHRQTVGVLIATLSIAHAPYFGYWMGKHEATCYMKYGVKVTGTVTEAFYSDEDGARMYYEFLVNGTTYVSYNVDNLRHHGVGDTIEVVYNSENPNMNSATENL